ncbi:nucleotidyltransferase domain-containing protein [Kribbella sp. NPDC051586]|uniref:nucleotidyltransferase domain-containing protein n=1 Tax=Kribbella sp. NPDC051586 TaxID=3364118 RepID=UPI0037B58C7B
MGSHRSGTNDLAFVRHVVGWLESAGVKTWLFGGWAAELLGLELPRTHHDVDLLYPGESFAAADALFARGEVDEVVAKRLPHKRAFEMDGVLVELFLVQGPAGAPFTDYWGVTRHEWPANVLEVEAGGLRVASALALLDYEATFDKRVPTVDGERVTVEEWLAEHESWFSGSA